MSALEKRIDLRFGDFACSVQGFEDPVELLTRLLREIQSVLAERPPEAGGPLFDEETLARLQAEISSVCGEGAVSAMPGLVLRVGEPEAGADSPAAAPISEQALDADPDAVAADLRAALSGEDSGDTDDAGNMFGEPDDDAAAGADGTNIFSGGGPETDAPPYPYAPGEEDEPEPYTPAGESEPEPFELPKENRAAEDPPRTNLFGAAAAGGDEKGDDLPNMFDEETDADSDDGGNVTQIGSFRDLARFDTGTAEDLPADEPALRSGISAMSAADFAKKVGATTPPDLIAASAAWLAVVRGHHTFTRREVLDVFQALPGDHEKTAETKVKGFGKLVRNGQVKLTEDDRFRLSDAERDRYEDLLG